MVGFAKVLIELSTTILAAGIGAVVYRKVSPPFKMMFWQVILYLVFDLIGIALSPRNAGVYNAFMPVETGLLLLSAWLILKEHHKPWLFLGCYMFFLGVYATELSWTRFAYHSAITEGILLTCIYLLVLYNVVQKRTSGDPGVAIACMSIGLVLYFACTTPYLCTIYYFANSNFGGLLHRYIIVLLALLRYLLVAISFLLALPRKPIPVYERN